MCYESRDRTALAGCLVFAILVGCRPNVPARNMTKGSSTPPSLVQGHSRMIKLYRRLEEKTLYWEAWENQGVVTIHRGVVGDKGQAREIQLLQGDGDGVVVINEEAIAPRRDGFRELSEEEQISFVIQFRLDNWGSQEDLRKRHAVEDVMNECLGWTGNGHCDGGDIGSGSINVYCFVIDPVIAATSTIEWLREKNLAEGVVIAYEKGDDYIVLWPKDFVGEFSPL